MWQKLGILWLIVLALTGSMGCAPGEQTGGGAVEAAEDGVQWLTNFDHAVEKAGKEDKRILIDFTGSDWCIWCKRLKKEIFDTDAFHEYARKHLVLVVLDFPRRKPISREQKEHNARLARKFGIRGYPTLIVLNSEGERIGKLGYMRGGPEPFLKALDGIR